MLRVYRPDNPVKSMENLFHGTGFGGVTLYRVIYSEGPNPSFTLMLKKIVGTSSGTPGSTERQHTEQGKVATWIH